MIAVRDGEGGVRSGHTTVDRALEQNLLDLGWGEALRNAARTCIANSSW